MQANPRGLERIFDKSISYQIPLFQRPYVWNEEDNWGPLWADIQVLLDKQLTTGRTHPHFLGAAVFEQLGNATGSVESRQVIDGQQRLTTLQLFLIAAKDMCTELDDVKYVDRFTDLTRNKESRIDLSSERYKVWPTNIDREDFKVAHNAGSPKSLLDAYDVKGKRRVGHRIADAYLYFSEVLRSWANEEIINESNSVAFSVDDKMEALWQVVRSKLQIVVIDLEDGDESQVIFETLNARGTKLLPADLVKNYLFHKADKSGAPIEQLYEQSWKGFDTDFWREEIKQGRLLRPRVDIFLQHYLSLKTLDDVRVTHLFNAFKDFAETGAKNEDGSELPEKSAADHLQSLSKYREHFASFQRPTENSRLAVFLRRLYAVDTATVYPFLLEASYTLSKTNSVEFERVLGILESFLIRRMICRLTAKNYNKLFIDLVKGSTIDGVVSADSMVTFLLKGDGESNRFPNDEEFKSAWLENPSYSGLAQYKIRAVLAALDAHFESAKSEAVGLPDGLTIEHVMPQQWQDHWPLDIADPGDELQKQNAGDLRNLKLQNFGNLTLITDSLNPSLSNSSWATKKPELMKFSKLNLTRYFHDKENWGESDITERGEYLFEAAVNLWPYPSS
jgi:uncharacterized protein with ParB-like and HNH nuclease domain